MLWLQFVTFEILKRTDIEFGFTNVGFNTFLEKKKSDRRSIHLIPINSLKPIAGSTAFRCYFFLT